MDIRNLYQGYPINKNRFFAPCPMRRMKTPELLSRRPKTLILSKQFLQRLTTPLGKEIEKDEFLSSNQERNIITPENLTYHIQRNSLAKTPVPRKFRCKNTSPYFKQDPINLYFGKTTKKSCDVAVQNVSIESMQFRGVYF